MVKTVKIAVATGNIDADGDIITPGAVKDLPKMTLLTHNFRSTEPIGKAEVFEEDGQLKMKLPADLADKFRTHYPALGFSIVKYRQEEGVRVLEEINLHTVGICENPNIDPAIKQIGEQ